MWGHGSHDKIECEPSFSQRVNISCFLQDTRRVSYIIKSGKRIIGDREKIHIKRKWPIAILDGYSQPDLFCRIHL